MVDADSIDHVVPSAVRLLSRLPPGNGQSVLTVAGSGAGASLPLIRDNKLRALAVSSSQRLPQLPDVAPFAEAAPAPDFEAVSWHMLFAPAATPKEIVQKLHDEMKRIMAAPQMRERASAIGLLPLDTPSLDDTRAYLASEREKWGSLVKKLGLEATQ